MSLKETEILNADQVGPASCPVRVVRFSADGRLVVTGHDTGTVQVPFHWKIEIENNSFAQEQGSTLSIEVHLI